MLAANILTYSDFLKDSKEHLQNLKGLLSIEKEKDSASSA